MNPGALAAAQQQRALAPQMVLGPQQVVAAQPGRMGIACSQALQVKKLKHE